MDTLYLMAIEALDGMKADATMIIVSAFAIILLIIGFSVVLKAFTVVGDDETEPEKGDN